MDDTEAITQALGDLLGHLYDSPYDPARCLYEILGIKPEQGLGQLQGAVIQEIRRLEPTADTPPGTRATRIYDVLLLRYIRRLTQEDVAERLCITPRHLRREQKQAIEFLAQRLPQKHSRLQETEQANVVVSGADEELGESRRASGARAWCFV